MAADTKQQDIAIPLVMNDIPISEMGDPCKVAVLLGLRVVTQVRALTHIARQQGGAHPSLYTGMSATYVRAATVRKYSHQRNKLNTSIDHPLSCLSFRWLYSAFFLPGALLTVFVISSRFASPLRK